MAFKINGYSGSVSNFSGPSDSYYTAKNRFNTILEQKLGVSSTDSQTSTGTTTTSATKATAAAIASDVTLKSGATAEEINEKLSGTALYGLGGAFAEAEKKYGVNAWFLTGLAIQESGYGTSRIAADKNNLFGFQAYDASPYASAKQFSSEEEGIDYVAKYLSDQYLSESGKYYNGLSIADIGKRYATDQNWASAITQLLGNLVGA